MGSEMCIRDRINAVRSCAGRRAPRRRPPRKTQRAEPSVRPTVRASPVPVRRACTYICACSVSRFTAPPRAWPVAGSVLHVPPRHDRLVRARVQPRRKGHTSLASPPSTAPPLRTVGTTRKTRSDLLMHTAAHRRHTGSTFPRNAGGQARAREAARSRFTIGTSPCCVWGFERTPPDRAAHVLRNGDSKFHVVCNKRRISQFFRRRKDALGRGGVGGGGLVVCRRQRGRQLRPCTCRTSKRARVGCIASTRCG